MTSHLYKLVAASIILIAGCHPIEDSLQGRCIYAGKVFLSDTLTGLSQPIETDSIIKVKLALASSSNYLYEKKTTGKGDFPLDFLETDKDYRLIASLKVNGVLYEGDKIFKPRKCDRQYYLNLIDDTVKLVLYASTANRNTSTIFVIDEDSLSVPKAEVCIFTSRELFNTRSCLNSNNTVVGNEAGKAVFNNIPGGKYYLYAGKRLDTISNAPLLLGVDSFTIPTTGIVSRKLLIK